LIFHLNGSIYDTPTTISIKNSKTNDFIVYGDNAAPKIARINGIDGSARWTITIDIVNCRKSGERFVNRLRIRPLFDDAGKLLYFVGAQNPI
jgi:hypothetical protein